MTRLGIAAMLLLLAACGQVPSRPASAVASPSQSATPAATAPTAPLVAVLEAKGTASAWTYNTVAIAGLDGIAVAKTTFTPMPVPNLGCMGAIIPPSAHVAAGKVYFADGSGVVRSLGIDNTVTTVATFPITSSQQMLSFAVSPDGTRLLGTVFTIPNNVFSCTGSQPATTYAFDAYAANSGGASHLLYHLTWATTQDVLALTGWDSVGPFGTYPTVWASQGGGPGSMLGVFVRVDAATLKPGAPFSDPATCQVWSSIATGAFACLKNPVPYGTNYVSTGSVRRSDGTEAWTFSVVAVNGAFGARLSPAGDRVAVCCLDVRSGFGYVALTNGAPAQMLANGFEVQAWVDRDTLIGTYHPDPTAQPPFDLGYVALSSPGVAVSMGFKGFFVGTVRS